MKIKGVLRMIVEWKRDNVKVIPSAKLGKNFILLPGANLVDSKEWEIVSKEAGLDKGYEAQYLKIITDNVDVKQGAVVTKKEVKEIEEFGSETSREVINNMYKIKDLEDLLKKEGLNSDTRYVIEKRIDELKSAKANKKIGARDE